MEPDSPQRCTEGGREPPVTDMQHRKLWQNKKKKLFTVKVVSLEQVAQRGCGISILGDTQNSTGQGWATCCVTGLVSAGGWTRGTSRPLTPQVTLLSRSPGSSDRANTACRPASHKMLGIARRKGFLVFLSEITQQYSESQSTSYAHDPKSLSPVSFPEEVQLHVNLTSQAWADLQRCTDSREQ